MIAIVGIHPDIMEIPVCAVPDHAEASAAILAHNQCKVRLVNLVLVFRIDDQVGEVKRPPDHPIAAVSLFPRFAAIFRAEKSAARRFDHSVHNIWFCRGNRDGNAPPGFRREPFGALFIQLIPGASAIGGLEKTAAAGRGGILTARTERPSLPAKVPHAREKDFGVLRIHGNHRTAGREIRAFENHAPALAAVGSFVDPAVLAVAP